MYSYFHCSHYLQQVRVTMAPTRSVFSFMILALFAAGGITDAYPTFLPSVSKSLSLNSSVAEILPKVTKDFVLVCDWRYVPTSNPSMIVSLTMAKWNESSNKFDDVLLVGGFKPDQPLVIEETGASISGQIQHSGHSYLKMQWDHPERNAAGLYKCELITITLYGVMSQLKVNLYVGFKPLDLWTLAETFMKMESKLKTISILAASQEKLIESQGEIMKSSFASLRESFAALNEEMASQRDKQETVNASFAALNEEMASQRDKQETVNASFAALNEEMASQRDKQETMNASFAALNEEMTSMKDKQETLNTSFAALNEEMASQRDKQESMNASFAALNEEMASQKDRLQRQEEAMNTSIAVLNGVVATQEDKLLRQEETINSSFAFLNGEMATQENRLERQEDFAMEQSDLLQVLNETLMNHKEQLDVHNDTMTDHSKSLNNLQTSLHASTLEFEGKLKKQVAVSHKYQSKLDGLEDDINQHGTTIKKHQEALESRRKAQVMVAKANGFKFLNITEKYGLFASSQTYTFSGAKTACHRIGTELYNYASSYIRSESTRDELKKSGMTSNSHWAGWSPLEFTFSGRHPDNNCIYFKTSSSSVWATVCSNEHRAFCAIEW